MITAEVKVMDYTKVIAIDFDGTLFTNKWPEIGEPVDFVIRQAKREQEAGAKLIMWTNRTGDLLDAAIHACESVGLHFDAVNESLPEWVIHFGTDPRKIGASEYWDDKAVSPSMIRYRDDVVAREEALASIMENGKEYKTDEH